MAKRVRVHSRDLQPQIAAPKGLFAAARVQRFDWPLSISTMMIDELGRKLHVGTTQDTPEVTVTMEAFDVSHNTFAYLTGYTPATFPASGVSITEFKNVDVIGQIKDTSTNGNIVNSLYVKRGIVTGMDASFGVRDNSTVSYTVTANSKKELKNPVFYKNGTLATASGSLTLDNSPVFLPITSGYTLNGFRLGTDGTYGHLTEGTDYSVSGTTVSFTGTNTVAGDTVWVTYTSATTKTFEALDDSAPAAIQGKYVPVTISVNSIPRVQSASIRVSFASEQILEMGGLGKPVGVEIGVPSVTGDISVLKTDNDLLAILTGQASTTAEVDVEYARTDLPLKIQLKDPRDPSRVAITYYVPSITITAEGDDSTVNASMNETFSWESVTGELIIASGAGPW